MNFIQPFRISDPDEIVKLIADLGPDLMAHVISVDNTGTPISSFLPVDHESPGKSGGLGAVIFHLAATNPQLDTFRNAGKVLVEIMSEHRYVSPSEFSDRNRAPTNIHIAIQLLGHAQIVGDAEKRMILERQVRAREEANPDGWKTDELQGDGYERRLKGISAARMPIDSAMASMRMLQDESLPNVLAVLRKVDTEGPPWAGRLIRRANAHRLEQT